MSHRCIRTIIYFIVCASSKQTLFNYFFEFSHYLFVTFSFVLEEATELLSNNAFLQGHLNLNSNIYHHIMALRYHFENRFHIVDAYT